MTVCDCAPLCRRRGEANHRGHREHGGGEEESIHRFTQIFTDWVPNLLICVICVNLWITFFFSVTFSVLSFLAVKRNSCRRQASAARLSCLVASACATRELSLTRPRVFSNSFADTAFSLSGAMPAVALRSLWHGSCSTALAEAIGLWAPIGVRFPTGRAKVGSRECPAEPGRIQVRGWTAADQDGDAFAANARRRPRGGSSLSATAARPSGAPRLPVRRGPLLGFKGNALQIANCKLQKSN